MGFGVKTKAIVTSSNHTNIVATIPDISASRVTILVIVASKFSAHVWFKYNSPKLSSIIPDSGLTRGGTTIVLRGTGFGNSGYVYFGPNRATSISSYTTTKITLNNPPGEGKVQVRVKPSNSDITSPKEFSYAIPIITSINPIQGNPGTILTVIGENFGFRPDVFIDGDICITMTKSHTKITCKVTAGQGIDKPVVVWAKN